MTGCAQPGKKVKGFKHDTPLIKTDVKKIKKIGNILIKIKKINFLSFKLIRNFIFLTSKIIKKKKGIIIPICLKRKIIGFCK